MDIQERNLECYHKQKSKNYCDPLLVKFMINDDRSMTLKEVEESIKGWKK